MTAQASIRPLADLTDRDIEAWRDLATRAQEPNPFFEPDFVLAAARELRTRRIALLTVREADGWTACMPVRRVARWRRLPVPALTSWRHRYCYLGTPLVDSGRSSAAVAALVEQTCGRGSHGLFTAFEWIGGGGPVASALEHELGQRSRNAVLAERFERATLLRRPDPASLTERLSTKRQKELRRQGRRLEAALGDALEVVELSPEPDGVERFMQMEASGWKGRANTALLSRPGDARFFRSVCQSFEREDRLQLLSLQAGGKSVAMQCNFVGGDGLFCFKVAHDEGFANCSPGVQLETKAFEVFHQDTRLNWMDSCADPHNDVVNRLFPDRRTMQTMLIGASTVVRRAPSRDAQPSEPSRAYSPAGWRLVR